MWNSKDRRWVQEWFRRTGLRSKEGPQGPSDGRSTVPRVPEGLSVCVGPGLRGTETGLYPLGLLVDSKMNPRELDVDHGIRVDPHQPPDERLFRN